MLKPPSEKISAETREKLLALADFIESDQEHALRMDSYLNPDAPLGLLPEPPPDNFCGTTACLAGYLAIIRGDAYELYLGPTGQFFYRGRDDLNITNEQAVALFLTYPHGTITRAKAVRVLRNFAYTGEVDWTV